jgi:hypothetical protein
MQISYELTEQDFRDGFRAYFNSRGVFRWARRLVFVAILLIALLLALGAATGNFNRLFLQTLAPAVIVLGIWIAVLWLSPWLGARRQFRNQPAAQGTKTLTVSDSGLEWQGTTGKSEAYWITFVRWTESESLLLLFPSPAFFYMLPKRAFAPGQLSEFRQMLVEKIGPMNKQRKAI